MELLENIIRKLDKESLEELMREVSATKDSKSRQFLQLLGDKSIRNDTIPARLKLTQGAFYTLKSRLVPKVVKYYTNLNENKIRLLREEAARVPFIVFNNERLISLSFLKDLEKKLKVYDLSAELASVYKQLARLNRFDSSFSYYEKNYQKHIAFSLAVSKAEDLLYEYIYLLGYFHITGSGYYRQKLEDLLEELENIFNLYESHRLFTLFNIVKHYHQCCFLSRTDLLQIELEVEKTLNTMSDILDKYHLDPFYGVIRNLIPFLYFEYYVKIGNQVKSNYYLEKISDLIEYQFKAHLWSFFITQFIISLIDKLKQDDNSVSFIKFNEKMRQGYFVEENELSHLLVYFRYKAMAEFLAGNYSKAALVVNNLRNFTSFKDFPVLEIELKLFQALMYVLLGESDLYQKLVSSSKRQAKDIPEAVVSVKSFSKVLFLLHKSHFERVNIEKLKHYWAIFRSESGNPAKLLHFLAIKEDTLGILLEKR